MTMMEILVLAGPKRNTRARCVFCDQPFVMRPKLIRLIPLDLAGEPLGDMCHPCVSTRESGWKAQSRIRAEALRARADAIERFGYERVLLRCNPDGVNEGEAMLTFDDIARYLKLEHRRGLVFRWLRKHGIYPSLNRLYSEAVLEEFIDRSMSGKYPIRDWWLRVCYRQLVLVARRLRRR
jgi:hypothetical protein